MKLAFKSGYLWESSTSFVLINRQELKAPHAVRQTPLNACSTLPVQAPRRAENPTSSSVPPPLVAPPPLHPTPTPPPPPLILSRPPLMLRAAATCASLFVHCRVFFFVLFFARWPLWGCRRNKKKQLCKWASSTFLLWVIIQQERSFLSSVCCISSEMFCNVTWKIQKFHKAGKFRNLF